MKPNFKKDDIRPIHIGVLTEFPFIDETFDSVTEWQILQKLGGKTNEISGKTNEIIRFINSVLEQKLNEYINEYIEEKFNDMMIDSMYDAETETLILYLNHTESEE